MRKVVSGAPASQQQGAKLPRKISNPTTDPLSQTPISLPPDLDDPEVRGEVCLQILKFTWKGVQPKSVREVVVRVKWWGEQGHGCLILYVITHHHITNVLQTS